VLFRSRKMEVIVPDDQLSLAIGRKGQNVKLAVQLTGWNVDIRSETELMESATKAKEALKQIPEISETAIELLFQSGIETVEDMAQADAAELAEETAIPQEKVELLIENAKRVLVEITARKAEIASWAKRAPSELEGADEETSTALEQAGIITVARLAAADLSAASNLEGAVREKAEALRAAARVLLGIPEPEPEPEPEIEEAPAAETAGEPAAAEGSTGGETSTGEGSGSDGDNDKAAADEASPQG